MKTRGWHAARSWRLLVGMVPWPWRSSPLVLAALVAAGPGCAGNGSPAGAGGTPPPPDLAIKPPAPPPVEPFVRGLVTSQGKPLAGARVRLQGASDHDGPRYVLSGVDGAFDLPLPGRKAGDVLVITAGADGYRSVAVTLPAAGQQAQVELPPLGADNAAYPFVAAGAVEGGCAGCHTALATAWGASQHAAAARDPLFLDENRRHLTWWQKLEGKKVVDDVLYAGPFLANEQKGDVGKTFNYGYEVLRILGDNQAVGECAKCHSPAYSLVGGVDPRPRTIAGKPAVYAEGVSCDVCHKIRAVDTSDEDKLALPGFDKVTLARPAAGAAVSLGPFDDITSPDMPSSYSPAYDRSEYCATCHSDARVIRFQEIDNQGNLLPQVGTRTIWGEDSYREWRFTPGSVSAIQLRDGGTSYAPRGDGPFTTTANYAGRPLQCQECHMQDPPPDPSTGERIADFQYTGDNQGEGTIAQRKDAVRRDARALHPHRMEGRTARFIAWATELSAQGTRQGDKVVVTVRLENRHTGHAFPTGLPDRNVLLVVEASDDKGPLPLTAGPTVPWWASGDGKGDPARDLAGRPGRGYGRPLVSADGEAPVFYLRAVAPAAEDTRLLAGGVDQSSYTFTPRSGPVTVRARVLHRLRFKAQTDRFLAANPGADPAQFETPGDQVELVVN